MQIIRRPWKLKRDDCPCDPDFVDWLAGQDLRDQAVFHFGTGDHHLVGLSCARGDRGHSVLGITASPGEHDAYVKLAKAEPEMTKRYVTYFADIYNMNARLLPEFDLVTLFHLCEFADESIGYRALNDASLVRMLGERLRPGGRMLFYTGSYAYPKARPIIEDWAASAGFAEVEGFRSLQIFQRT